MTMKIEVIDAANKPYEASLHKAYTAKVNGCFEACQRTAMGRLTPGTDRSMVAHVSSSTSDRIGQ